VKRNQTLPLSPSTSAVELAVNTASPHISTSRADPAASSTQARPVTGATHEPDQSAASSERPANDTPVLERNPHIDTIGELESDEDDNSGFYYNTRAWRLKCET